MGILLNDNCSNDQKGYQKHDYHCPHIYPFIGEFGSVFDLSRGGERAFVLYYQYHLH